MLNYIFATVFIAFISLQTTFTAQTGPSHNRVVVCYIGTWAVYRPSRGSFNIDEVDPTLCTHLVYAFAGLDIMQNHIKSLDPWQDLIDEYGKDGYNRLTRLKRGNPHLKVTLAIGGWNEGSANYSKLASDPGRRQVFVQQSLEFVRKFNFDGLDLDWEYPANRGGNPEDKQNFALLVRELKEAYSKYGLILTSAIGAAKSTIDSAYDVKEIAKHLDFMHIMCYDYGGAWDRRVTANAPLSADGVLSIEYTIEYLMQLGAPANKLVVGLPFYGRTFISELEGKLGDAADNVGFKGPYTNENGFMGYNEICSAMKNSSYDWETEWHEPSAEMLARYKDPQTGKTHAVTFDTQRSIATKIRYIVQKDLAGAMAWSIDTDDFKGDCDEDPTAYKDFGRTPGINLSVPNPPKGRYSLLKMINQAFGVAEEEWQLEKEKKARDEMDRENEIVPPAVGTDSGATEVTAALVVVVAMFSLNRLL